MVFVGRQCCFGQALSILWLVDEFVSEDTLYDMINEVECHSHWKVMTILVDGVLNTRNTFHETSYPTI